MKNNHTLVLIIYMHSFFYMYFIANSWKHENLDNYLVKSAYLIMQEDKNE